MGQFSEQGHNKTKHQAPAYFVTCRCAAGVYIHGHGLEPFLLKAWVAARDFREGLNHCIQTCLALIMVNTKQTLIPILVGSRRSALQVGLG
jgi:hypothetical protein